MNEHKPWHVDNPVVHVGETTRYQRACRLTKFERHLQTWQRMALKGIGITPTKIAYRRAAIEDWAYYLDHGIPRPELVATWVNKLKTN